MTLLNIHEMQNEHLHSLIMHAIFFTKLRLWFFPYFNIPEIERRHSLTLIYWLRK